MAATNLRPQKKVTPAPLTNPEFEKLREADNKPVRGKFIFHEVPGGQLAFTFKKWPGDRPKNYELVDGQIYTVPIAVAKHLNKECKYPVHAYQMDENNKPQMKVNQWVRRCSFQSLEFIDDTDMTPVGTGNPDPATI